MPKKTEFPQPTKRFLHGAWVILWRYSPAPNKYKQYTVSTGLTREKEDEQPADIVLRRFAVALAQTSPEFPAEYARTSGVIRYLEDRFGPSQKAGEAGFSSEPTRWLQNYEPVIKRECSSSWANNSLAYLKALDRFVTGGIGKTDANQANRFLEHVHQNGISNRPKKRTGEEGGASNGTRNRALAACSRFFQWCLASGAVASSPFAGIKMLREDGAEVITYCTAAERDRILVVARGLGRPDWIAIPIALYAGCRREEIFRLQWTDVNFDNRHLIIRFGKTGKRKTPIARELLEILTAARAERGAVIQPIDDMTWANQADRLVELVREALCIPEHPTFSGTSSEPIGKRHFLKTEEAILSLPVQRATLTKKIAKTKEKASARTLAMELAALEAIPEHAHDGGSWLPAERIGWNAWRHTFATLRVQAGVSLDKISAWMGNTPEVCKKHYAEFIPRDSHDEDIDK